MTARMPLRLPLPLLPRLLVIALLALPLASGAANDAAPPLRFTLDAMPDRELWGGVEMGGAKVGYVHMAIAPLAQGRYEIRSRTSIFLRMQGTAKSLEFRMRDVVRGDLSLETVEADMLMDGNRLHILGRVEDGGRLQLQLDNSGGRSSRVLEASGRLVPASAISLYALTQGLQPGRAYRFSAFMSETLQIAPVEQKVEADAGGFVVRSRVQGAEATSWFDARGRAVAEAGMGGGIRVVVLDEARAKAYLAAAQASDGDAVIDLSLVRPDRSIALPARVSRMRIAIEGPGLEMPSGTGQSCARAGAAWECDLDSGRREGFRGDPAPWLAASLTVSSDDAGIVELSRKLTQDAATADAKILAILRWMDRNIRREGTDAFSARDVLASRRAECQGHSWLYAALARAAGIPTRVANGLVYSEANQGFLYHTWAESLIDGAWRAIDPTFGQATADATHIKLVDGEEYGDIAPLVDLIGRVSIRVGAYEHRK